MSTRYAHNEDNFNRLLLLRAASAQSFTLWQLATLEIMRRNCLFVPHIYIYMGVILLAHPVRGEWHIQRNANGEAATLYCEKIFKRHFGGVALLRPVIL